MKLLQISLDELRLTLMDNEQRLSGASKCTHTFFLSFTRVYFNISAQYTGAWKPQVSSHTESTDLVGGFRPTSVSQTTQTFFIVGKLWRHTTQTHNRAG